MRILNISSNEFNGPLPRKYFQYLKAMTNVDEGKVALKYMGEMYYQVSLNVTMKGLNIELVRIQIVFMIDKCNFYMIFIILLFIKIVSFPLFLLI